MGRLLAVASVLALLALPPPIPECQGVDAKAGGEFQVAVAIDAASASGDTQLSELVGGQCSEN
jgi:hypothetical protein